MEIIIFLLAWPRIDVDQGTIFTNNINEIPVKIPFFKNYFRLVFAAKRAIKIFHSLIYIYY